MDRVAVRSSNIASIGFDSNSGTLEVEFRTGAVYAYDGVPPAVHAGLMSAASHGKYLSANVKDRYTVRRIF